MKHDRTDRRTFLKTAATLPISLGGLAGSIASSDAASEIPRRTLGRTGLSVTMIGLGGYHQGTPEKEEDSIAIVHRALDLGINFFDNADCYQNGRAEERMGKALEGRRQKIILMTKVDQRDAAGARQTLETSLRRLRTDYLDIWQFHGVGSLDELSRIFAPGGALETAEQARKEGKIRFLGLTGHYDPAVHLEAVRRYPFDTIQMPVNCVDPHFKSFRKTVLDEAVKRNVGVIAMKTLSFGNIVSKGVAKPEEALRWSWSQPISVLVSGCDSLEVLERNVRLARTFRPMPSEEQATLVASTRPHAGTEVEWYKKRP